jgi:hypothetical protein
MAELGTISAKPGRDDVAVDAPATASDHVAITMIDALT